MLRSGHVELRHTLIHIEAAISQVVRVPDDPDRQFWAEECLRSDDSDADAIRAFGSRDGR
ncbi:MAG: hypothetical protein AVDCRST_MAG24-104 [uncultured Nocardioidaceae bacterium]|uniref:Uncharacterized protein n=1 Tax=uncultured Nocardioidaceae bacterium TaxID=253824 RepID=A0A6J4KWL7_9ACTN|nr:MAG: hypothetical protein AVDCRST_MAG24-104 [uncultured Nocardioidaceae bacterium]